VCGSVSECAGVFLGVSQWVSLWDAEMCVRVCLVSRFVHIVYVCVCA
jgi:hypothetical protein